MQPQEQQPIPTQAVYYVPVQAAPAPAPAQAATTEAWQATPPWARTIEDRLTMHSVVLTLIALMVLGNLILTFVLVHTIDSALHPFGG